MAMGRNRRSGANRRVAAAGIGSFLGPSCNQAHTQRRWGLGEGFVREGFSCCHHPASANVRYRVAVAELDGGVVAGRLEPVFER